MLYVLEDFHGVVLPVEDFGHDLHVALWNALVVPKFFQICKCFINCFLLPFLIFAKIGFITNFVYVL